MYILRYRIGGRTFCIVSCGMVRCSSAFFANEKKEKRKYFVVLFCFVLLFCFVFLIYIFPCVRWLNTGVRALERPMEGRKEDLCRVTKESP